MSHKFSFAKTKSAQGKKKKKDSSKAFTEYLSEELKESWQDLGRRLDFTQLQLDQLQTSYSGDERFCAHVMLKDWQNVAKKFLRRPEAHISIVLRKMGKQNIAESVIQRSKMEYPGTEEQHDVTALSHVVRGISFVPGPESVAEYPGTEEQHDVTALSHVVRGISFVPGPESVAGPTVPQGAYSFSNCNTVIIGNRNTIIDAAENQSQTSEIKTKESPDEKLIRSLEMIIEMNPSKTGTKIQKIESECQKLFSQDGKKQTFQNVTGMKLLQFLQNHNDRFLIYYSSGVCLVQKTRQSLLHKVSHIQLDATKEKVEEKMPSVEFYDETDSDDDDFHENINTKQESPTAKPTENVKSYADAVGNKAPTIPATDMRQPSQRPRPVVHLGYPESENVQTDPRDLITFVNNFSRGHYILLICCKEKMKYLDCLALVPWLAVFDFDEESRNIGLLSVLEERIKKMRAIYTCTWKDHARFSDFCTEWCMIRGSVQEADSKTPQDSREWYKAVRSRLDQHFEKMACFTETYTTVKCIMVLPDDEETLSCMQKTIAKLEEHIDPAPVIIVCDPMKMPYTSTNWIYKAVHVDFKLRCNFQDFCKALSTTPLADGLKYIKTTYRLPTSDDTNNPGLEESFVSVLREELEVLYLDYPRNRPVDLDELQEEGEKFLKGGTLRWFVLYECTAGHFDAERDIMESIVNRVKEKFLEPFKSGIIKLYHAPGSGGTTLMQRVLWELRKSSLCAQVKMHATISVQDLAHNLESLFEKTHLPLVLLIDGGEDKLTKQLLRLLGHVSVVILQVKRYPHNIMMTEHPNNKFYLKGKVSEKEATKLAVKFMNKCDNDDKKDALNELVDDVHRGHSHSVYEFGLTTFLEQYRGIASYVRGYLQLEDNKTKSLQPWQEILGYLSMAYFYGQTSMPCQFFVTMLGKPLNYDVAFSDFPHYVQELIVQCDSEGRKNNIRICHYIIARGILDQILTWPQKYVESDAQVGLSVIAKSKLINFAYKFIEESKKRSVRPSDRSNTIIETLTRTFLHRDYKDVGEGEISARKRPLSTLLEDIHCKAPYTERIKVIEKLVTTFPENPNFHAHLGRIYTICKPEEVEMAEKCFVNALDLCKKQTRGKRIDDINESTKRSLMHIYHMFGMHYLRRIAKYTGRCGEKPAMKTAKEQYPRRISEILGLAELACEHFTKRREITPLGSEEGYGYIGEITVRLQVCNFISRYFPKGVNNFGEFLRDAKETASVKFVRESITEIVELFMECYSAVDAGELDHEYYDNVNMYNALFNNHVPVLEYIAKPADISTRCLKAAAIKLKYGKDATLGILEMITSRVDIEEIVKIYEDCFEEIQEAGLTVKRRVLEMCYKEWITAIRHNLFPVNYTQDNVLLHIRQWSSFLRSPMSKFYLFCMLSIIGIGTHEARGNADHLWEAAEVREELQQLRAYFPKPRLPREWLGKGSGIKALIPGSRLGNIEERNVKGENTSCLVFLKGTIRRPNRQKQTGFIDLDLGENVNTIKIFFVPVRTEEKLVGQTYAGERVEFTLAFTTANGWEAYNVKRIKKNSLSRVRQLCGNQKRRNLHDL